MKIYTKNIVYLSIFLTFSSLMADEDIFDKSLEDIVNMQSELKAEVGSRNGATNFLYTKAAIDVITFDQIEYSGLTSLTAVLNYFVAGFNAPSPSLNDGSDHVRAFTLRGMSSDQILVLVNGKRLHTSSLIHVNDSIGRGASHVDLDTIAVKSIEKIEILRDGAAAQYGSDAIAGVINIILKGNGHTNNIGISSGIRKNGDGTKLQADTFITYPLKYDGFLNATLSAQKENDTQHAGADRRLETPTVQTHYGLPESKNFQAVVNTEAPQSNNVVLYSNALLNYRESSASAFYRVPDSSRVLYPDGFLPLIQTKILDYSVAFGVNGELTNGIYWDLSNVYGYNHVQFGVDDSINYALGASSPTFFNNNGTLTFIQNTTNLDIKKSFDKLDLAGGAEYRYENYKITAGDTASYYNGGSQGFAGFRPENETDSSRNNYAFYVDGTYHFTSDFSWEGAGRYENYSDFGSTSNIKLALGYRIIPEIFLRTSASTGFRAPSLAQSKFSQTSSFYDTTAIMSQGTFVVDSEVSKILGAQSLKPEKSKHLAFGGLYEPMKDLTFMVDYFFIKVDDRIMLSSQLTGDTPIQQSVLASNNVSAARFFTNAVNTQTRGIDLKLNYKYLLENHGKLDFGFWYNYHENKVIQYNSNAITQENFYEQIDMLENGQPKESMKFLTNYNISSYNIVMNLNRYGSYHHAISGVSYEFNPMTTVDMEIAYAFSKNVNLAIGGNNIFDTMPNKWKNLDGIGFGNNGILPYSSYSPIGFSGAFYYARATIRF